PARVVALLVMDMRLVVQILAAHRAQPGAVGPAEDLLRQRERERVPCPRREVELAVREIGIAQLVRTGGIRRLVLANRDRLVHDRLFQTAVAGTVETSLEEELEHRPGARL